MSRSARRSEEAPREPSSVPSKQRDGVKMKSRHQTSRREGGREEQERERDRGEQNANCWAVTDVSRKPLCLASLDNGVCLSSYLSATVNVVSPTRREKKTSAGCHGVIRATVFISLCLGLLSGVDDASIDETISPEVWRQRRQKTSAKWKGHTARRVVNEQTKRREKRWEMRHGQIRTIYVCSLSLFRTKAGTKKSS